MEERTMERIALAARHENVTKAIRWTAFFRAGEGWIVVREEWREGRWWRDLSTQSGPHRRKAACEAAREQAVAEKAERRQAA